MEAFQTDAPVPDDALGTDPTATPSGLPCSNSRRTRFAKAASDSESVTETSASSVSERRRRKMKNAIAAARAAIFLISLNHNNHRDLVVGEGLWGVF